MAGPVTRPPAILLGGPTASGKSGLAMRLAERFGGVLVNADSMQVYADLRVLTARPSAEAEAAAPHRLYGVMDAARRCSAGLWHGLARAAAAEAAAGGRHPILVGGTGLYLDAFRRGLSPIPDTPPAVRERIAGRMASADPAAPHAELARRDPASADVLAPGDSQRIQRALEVVEATGTPLSQWRRRPRVGGWNGPVLSVVLTPPREALYRRCDARFDRMLDEGALGEVERLAARGLDRSLPAMRALGVPHLMAHLDGRLGFDEAVARAKTGTRRYAKRQATWFRHRAPGALRIEAFGHAMAADGAAAAIERFLLTVRGRPA